MLKVIMYNEGHGDNCDVQKDKDTSKRHKLGNNKHGEKRAKRYRNKQS